MFGISSWELLVILLIGLIVLGPRQLAEVAKAVGKVYRDIQNMSWDFRRSIDQELKSISEPAPPITPKSSDSPTEPLPMPGEKSGPDFYADLLEAAAEKDMKGDTAEEQPPDETAGSEKQEVTPKEGKLS
ncbi:MAG: twin-arginine translocase TatA/TatE family subunit [Desulfomonile sp.]|nr:twin-arginine translocase TatA/TatE family subunit [Desulfomonile sp.]